MAITIIPLDNDHEENEDISIIVGRDVVVKFIPVQSLVEKNKSLQQIINKENLLTQDSLWDNLKNIQKSSQEIEDTISNIVNFRDTFTGPDTQDIETWISDMFTSYQDKIIEKSDKILQLEKEIRLDLGVTQQWCFCSKCKTYIGQQNVLIPSNCKFCKFETKSSTIKNIRILDSEVKNYLEGSWLEDYVANIFIKIGWKAWSGCSVMGSTGVCHQIDVLAVDAKTGKIVIIECKRTAKAEHGYRLITQFVDIQPGYGILLSLKKVNSDPILNLLKRKPGLKLLQLENLSDDQVEKNIREFVTSDQ